MKSAQQILEERLQAQGHPDYQLKGESKPKAVRSNGEASMFELANRVDTVQLLDRLGISHEETGRGEMATCPGCGESGALVCKEGGLKCLHDRCAHAGPRDKPGFRNPVAIVETAKSLDGKGAARWICESFGIPIPERKTNGREDPGDPHREAPDVPPGEEPPVGGGRPREGSAPTTRARTLADIVDAWREEGSLARVPTGIAPLDRLSRGGLAVPWRVIIVGAPSAGKTAVSIIVADRLARAADAAGMVVGILGVDEEPDDLAVRLLQIAGYTLDETEQRDPEVLTSMRQAVEGLRVRFYDDEWTIESAGADVAAWAKLEGRLGALFLDSLHAVRSFTSSEARTPREAVDANVRAMRSVSTRFRLLVVASSEANRASWRSEDAAETTNDLAAGAESRAIEYGGQTQLVLRTPKGHADVIHVRVAKNRRADRGEFWLRLDRGRHTVEECPDPARLDGDTEERKQEAARGEVDRDAKALAAIVFASPGMSERDLRDAVREAGHKWGRERLGAAKLRLQKGLGGSRLVDESPPDSKGSSWRLVPVVEGDRQGGIDAA